jgi:peptide/nickel transport system substrate-binding protein
LDFVLALKYLQRREKILKGIFKGMGSMGNDHPIGSAYLKHCADLPQRPFDPDKAKYHLKKSGITEAEMSVAEIKGGITDMCLLLQREASKIGLKLNVKRVPNDGYWGAVWMKTPICVSSWNMRPTANVMLTLAYKSDAPWNEVHWKNERFDELLLASRAEADPAKSQELYCEMQKLVSDDGGNVIPLHAAYLDAISSKVKGMPKVPLAATGGEWPEYAWIDS